MLLGSVTVIRNARLRPKKAPIQARAQATVKAILDATARILVARGYAGLTTNHVAAKAGVSVGTLYEWFPGKEALVLALVDRHIAQAEQVLMRCASSLAAEVPMMSPYALARSLATAMIELHEDDPRLHRVLSEEVPRPPQVRARLEAIEARATAALSALLASHPRMRAPDPELAARVIAIVLDAAAHRWATDPRGAPVPRDVWIEELARLIGGYLEGMSGAP
jgi:AcrR family transcriptional regulator